MIEVTVKVPESRVAEFYSHYGAWLTRRTVDLSSDRVRHRISGQSGTLLAKGVWYATVKFDDEDSPSWVAINSTIPDVRHCPECGGSVTGRANAIYCSRRCKGSASSRRRRTQSG